MPPLQQPYRSIVMRWNYIQSLQSTTSLLRQNHNHGSHSQAADRFDQFQRNQYLAHYVHWPSIMSHKIFCSIPLHVVAFIGSIRFPSHLEPFRDVSQEQAFSSDSFCPNIHNFPPKSDSTLRLTFPQNELWLRWSDGQVGVLECIGGIQYEIKHCQRHNGPRNWLRDLD